MDDVLCAWRPDVAHYYYAFLQRKHSALAASKEPAGCTNFEARNRLKAAGIELPTASDGLADSPLSDLKTMVVPGIGGKNLPLGVFPVLRTGV